MEPFEIKSADNKNQLMRGKDTTFLYLAFSTAKQKSPTAPLSVFTRDH